MKLETFFEKFDQFADAPDAVKKMRELVLELAVRGRLLSGDPSASSNPSAPFPIPDNWEWSLIGNVADACGQKIPDTSFTYIDVGSIDNTRGLIKAEPEVVAPENAPSRARKLVRPGTVIYATVRPYLKNIAVIEREFSPPAIVSTAFAILHPKPFLDARFLFFWLRSKAFEAQVAERMKGVAYPAINDGEFRACFIPLPPLAEQKRIVAKVDELMALCDRLETQQKEREEKHAALARASLARFADAPTPTNLDFIFHPSHAIPPADLRKSILTLAVQGDLSVGSSDPSAWTAVTMKEVCDLITDGEHATPQRVPSGVPLATAKNVRDGFLDMTQTDYVTLETAEKCWKRCRPKHGDILMVCVGATTGRVCLVANPPDMVLVRSVALLRPNTKRIEATFLDLFLRSPSGQAQIWGGVRQNAQPCLYLGKMSEFVIQLPPLAEQRRIVAKVDELMALVDELEAQLAASRAAAANLLSALVAALTGTPNNRTVSAQPNKGTGRRGRPPKS